MTSPSGLGRGENHSGQTAHIAATGQGRIADLGQIVPAHRRRIIGGIQREMKKKAGKNPEMQLLLDQEPASFEKSFTKDMGLFFKEAPLSMKLEMAPMLEAMQGRMQGMRVK